MEFEKALAPIKKSPKDFEKILAFLKLLCDEPDSGIRSSGLTLLAEILVDANPLLSATLVELAFRLAKEDEVSLRVLKALRVKSNINGRYSGNDKQDKVDDGVRIENLSELNAAAMEPHALPEVAPQVAAPQVAAPQVAAPQVAAPRVAAPQVVAPKVVVAEVALAPQVVAELALPPLAIEAKKSIGGEDLIQALLEDFNISEDLASVKSEFQGALYAASTSSVQLNQFLSLIHFTHYILFANKVKFSGGVTAWVKGQFLQLQQSFKSDSAVLGASQKEFALVARRFEELIVPFDRRTS